MITSSEDKAIARYLVSLGYKQVSNGARRIARVEVTDADLAKFFLRCSWGTRTGVAGLPMEEQRDYWRRCCATFFTVPESVLVEMRRLGAVAR